MNHGQTTAKAEIKGTISETKNSTQTSNVSRASLEAELAKLQVNPELLGTLTVDQLSDLLFGLNKAVLAQGGAAANKVPRKRRVRDLCVSNVDKKIMRALIESSGRPSSIKLSRELHIPVSTVQRRRRRLEAKMISESYTLRYENFGMRRIMFVVGLGTGHKSRIAEDILDMDKVRTVSRTFGESADLMFDAIVSSNTEVTEIRDRIKSITGVEKVSWFEALEVVGVNQGLDIKLIESK